MPSDVVALFERWREGVEQDIESWMGSASRNGGYPASWRDWGRGFNSIPDSDDEALGSAIREGFRIIKTPAPKKNQNAKKEVTRSKIIHIKCTEEEHEFWTQYMKEKGINMSDYVRGKMPRVRKG